MKMRWLWPALALGHLWNTNSNAMAPRLYSLASYQSPVRGDPDDLLVLAGDSLSAGLVAVYQAYAAAGIPQHPQRVPADASALSGVAPIVSTAGLPYQLMIRLPPVMLEHRPYRIWVKGPGDEWSNGVSINDSRPLWFSPSEAYSTAPLANLPRYIKVIGRNLFALDGGLPAVRLIGPKRYELSGATGESATPVSQDFVLERLLPKTLEPGQYRVELQTSETTWIPIPEQSFTVHADPKQAREFDVSDAAYGQCRPDDGQDDTGCVAKAIEAARSAGGGAVVFGRGTWNIAPGVLIVPPLVEIRGRGDAVTRVVRSSKPSASAENAEFVLLGRNIVSGITFADAETSRPHSDVRPILQIGRRYNTDARPQVESVVASDVVITRNVFDRTDGAIVDGGNPLQRLYITFNQFGDYRLGLNLGGNRYNVRRRFGISDAVIVHNRFAPGSYLDVELGQGAIASEIGASQRVDFSSNVADGASREYLYSKNDAPGWRAAFFWHMNDNHEMLLISDNAVNCSGDKDGDGEAIALDGNANTFGLANRGLVLRANRDSVGIAGPLKGAQNNRAVDVDTYYVGHWLRIDAGPGIGQSRRIVAIRRSVESPGVTFQVAPPWDVVPMPNVSTVSVAREFWQTMIIGNNVDQRKPLCLKSNRTRPRGGNISVWGQSADTVVEGNHQFDTDGIVFQQGYGAEDAACADCRTWTSIPSFLEIRNNSIDGEYDWNSACSHSGIMGSYGASPSPHAPPPLLSFAVSIAHNRIASADGLTGGAISIVPTWFSGPPGYENPLLEGLAIHHNEIRNISGTPPQAACGYVQDGRYGIVLQGDRHIDGTVLYANTCENVMKPLRDNAFRTKRECGSHLANSCECTFGNAGR
jgi:hypothetical protein